MFDLVLVLVDSNWQRANKTGMACMEIPPLVCGLFALDVILHCMSGWDVPFCFFFSLLVVPGRR